MPAYHALDSIPSTAKMKKKKKKYIGLGHSSMLDNYLTCARPWVDLWHYITN
jgi:hypothetical protein